MLCFVELKIPLYFYHHSRYVSNLAASAVRQQGRIIQRNLQQPSLGIPVQILQDSKENVQAQLHTIILSNSAP